MFPEHDADAARRAGRRRFARLFTQSIYKWVQTPLVAARRQPRSRSRARAAAPGGAADRVAKIIRAGSALLAIALVGCGAPARSVDVRLGSLTVHLETSPAKIVILDPDGQPLLSGLAGGAVEPALRLMSPPRSARRKRAGRSSTAAFSSTSPIRSGRASSGSRTSGSPTTKAASPSPSKGRTAAAPARSTLVADGTLAISLSVPGKIAPAPRFNAARANTLSASAPRPLDVDERGQTVPIWVSEQGIGKVADDDPPADWFFRGTRHQSYFPVPFFVSSRRLRRARRHHPPHYLRDVLGERRRLAARSLGGHARLSSLLWPVAARGDPPPLRPRRARAGAARLRVRAVERCDCRLAVGAAGRVGAAAKSHSLVGDLDRGLGRRGPHRRQLQPHLSVERRSHALSRRREAGERAAPGGIQVPRLLQHLPRIGRRSLSGRDCQPLRDRAGRRHALPVRQRALQEDLARRSHQSRRRRLDGGIFERGDRSRLRRMDGRLRRVAAGRRQALLGRGRRGGAPALSGLVAEAERRVLGARKDKVDRLVFVRSGYSGSQPIAHQVVWAAIRTPSSPPTTGCRR